MKVNAQPNWLEELSSGAKNSLSLNNQRIVDGSDDIVVNPAYESISDEDMKSSIASILETIDMTSNFRKMEDSNASSVGPRSIAKKWEERKDSLLDYYYGKEDADPGDFAGSSNGRRRPLSVNSAAFSLIRSSSSGLPYMTRKGHVLDLAVEQQQEHFGVFPCVLFTRTQEGGKTRNVWGYPVSDTLEEIRFFRPWFELEKAMDWRAALLGPDAVDRAMTNLLSGKAEDDSVVAVDFSSFDATVQPEHSYEAFSTIASTYQREAHADLYRLYRRFVTIPIWTPEGEIIGPHGVPSGSTFTNTVDSLVQYAASGYDTTRGDMCQVQGDDGVYLVPRDDRDSFIDRFISYGLKVNEQKSQTFDDREAIFLQRYYHPAYPSRTNNGLGGVYSAYRAFARIKYLERWTDFERIGIKGSDFFSLRTIMILENCKHHPAFDQLVRLAHKFDSTNLKFSNEGVKAFSKTLESRARAGVLHTESFDKGIDGFETVKVLRTL